MSLRSPGRGGWGGLCSRHWVSLREKRAFLGERDGRAVSVGAASPVCHRRAVRGGHTGDEGCPAPGAEGWSLWGPFGPAQQPLCSATLRAVSLSLPCLGVGCSLLLQFLTAICGQGSTWRDAKSVTSAPRS